MSTHIANYWLFKSGKVDSNSSNRQLYRELFDTLFEPYYSPVTFDEQLHRLGEFQKLLDTAIDFGLKASGHYLGFVQCRWGPRGVYGVLTYPALVGLEYEGEELKRTVEYHRRAE